MRLTSPLTERHRSLRRALIALAVAWPCAVISASSAFGLELKPEELRTTTEKKAVSVLQNRFFLKAWRPEFGVLAGKMLGEAYTSTTLLGVRSALFFSEWIGLEVQYMKSKIDETHDRKALRSLQYRQLSGDPNIIVSPSPEINAIHKIIDVAAIYAPFYGKLNLLNKYIAYTDLYVTGGVAQVETDQGMKSALSMGIGERIYMFESWSLRIDFKDRVYKELRAGAETSKHSLSIDLGASYLFF